MKLPKGWSEDLLIFVYLFLLIIYHVNTDNVYIGKNDDCTEPFCWQVLNSEIYLKVFETQRCMSVQNSNLTPAELYQRLSLAVLDLSLNLAWLPRGYIFVSIKHFQIRIKLVSYIRHTNTHFFYSSFKYHIFLINKLV